MSTPESALDPQDDAAVLLPADQPDGEQSPESPAPTPAELKALKAELRAEKRAREAAEKLADERKTVKEFWERRGQAAEMAPRSAPAAIEQDPLDDFDWLKTLTDESDPVAIKRNIAKVVKAQIAAELKRGNYVSREEAEGYVAQIVQGASAFNKLVADFPDLRDPDSAFFAETQKQLMALGADASLQGTPQAALERMAAQNAQLAMYKASKAPEAEPTEDSRYDRIARQRGGSPGRGPATETVGLNAAEKAMAAKLGIPEAKYLQRKREMMAPGAVGPALMADRMAREFGNG